MAEADAVDLDAAIALWQFETDRLNGLAAKGAAVLAADAIVATGIATQVSSSGLAALLCVASLIYLVSAVGGVFIVQQPQARIVVQPEHILNGTAAQEMISAYIANTSEGIAAQNLVYVGIRDTMVSLFLFIAALAVNIAN
ncbi:hypothetical protein [Nocardioides aurantiacus]|uniref:hypothetical protein n=1 Tax=Nocardioides aurantiacus TaxID=86796 RepID=UPI00403F3D62